MARRLYRRLTGQGGGGDGPIVQLCFFAPLIVLVLALDFFGARRPRTTEDDHDDEDEDEEAIAAPSLKIVLVVVVVLALPVRKAIEHEGRRRKTITGRLEDAGIS